MPADSSTSTSTRDRRVNSDPLHCRHANKAVGAESCVTDAAGNRIPQRSASGSKHSSPQVDSFCIREEIGPRTPNSPPFSVRGINGPATRKVASRRFTLLMMRTCSPLCKRRVLRIQTSPHFRPYQSRAKGWLTSAGPNGAFQHSSETFTQGIKWSWRIREPYEITIKTSRSPTTFGVSYRRHDSLERISVHTIWPLRVNMDRPGEVHFEDRAGVFRGCSDVVSGGFSEEKSGVLRALNARASAALPILDRRSSMSTSDSRWSFSKIPRETSRERFSMACKAVSDRVSNFARFASRRWLA